MPIRKIPQDAFDFYLNLGPDRSYEKVAKHNGATKRAVTLRARKEGWGGRLEEAERKALENSDRWKAKALETMNERHLQTARFLQLKALATLRDMPLEEEFSAVEALDISMRLERLIRGEPTRRIAPSAPDDTGRAGGREIENSSGSAPKASGGHPADRDRWQNLLHEVESIQPGDSARKWKALHLKICQFIIEKALESLTRIPYEEALRVARRFDAQRSRKRKSFTTWLLKRRR